MIIFIILFAGFLVALNQVFRSHGQDPSWWVWTLLFLALACARAVGMSLGDLAL